MVTQTQEQNRLHEYMGKILNDFGAAASAPLVLIGDRLGLFQALAEDGPLDSQELAGHTQTTERYVREWLAAMLASQYIKYDSAIEKFSMSPEQIAVFADKNSPVLMTGGFYSLASVFADETRVTDAFKTGRGVGWGDRDACLFCGVEKFFRPSYEASLVQDWLPALDGVVEKLRSGAMVADVGCGHGASTIIMAQAFSQSTFVGFDIHKGSIEHARRHAKELGLTNVEFEIATAKDFPGQWDLVTCFDCLHDMGDPVGAASHIHDSLANGGTWMIIEPMPGDRLEDNLNPVGRIYYAFSTTVCVPTSLSQEVGLALGTQAGEAKLSEVIQAGGFTDVRRATETPFNLILEAHK